MPTPLFSGNRGREPPNAISTRCSIRRAVGGSYLMARRLTDRRFRIRRRSLAACGDDRLSALSDDLLLLVLRRLDTRSALGTGLLSRRWAHLPRELPALDFRAGDILPARYHRRILRHRDVMNNGLFYGSVIVGELLPSIRRHERRAMRALASSVKSFLDADDDGNRTRRKVSRLRLEFFTTYNTGCINRLISRAIDAWGVDDLEAVAKPFYWQQAAHTFPSHGLCKEPARASRLRSLTLGGCVLPPLHEYGSLTKLVLQGMPTSTPAAAYEGVFTSCPQLQAVHLISCSLNWDSVLVVDAPRSGVRELVVDKCDFRAMWLRSLPNLESLASVGTRVLFESTSFPCPRQWNLAYCFGIGRKLGRCFAVDLPLESFLGCTPGITDLILRFTGPERWILPSCSPPSLLPNLTRLLVADVPSSWDVSWPRLLLETAPLLRSLDIHIAAPCTEKPGDEISWQPTVLRHHHLEEFVIAGFEGTERQIYLVRFVVGVSTALRHVKMFKDGHVEYKGRWNWEIMARKKQHSWTDKEKETMLMKIMDGFSCSTPTLQLVLG